MESPNLNDETPLILPQELTAMPPKASTTRQRVELRESACLVCQPSYSSTTLRKTQRTPHFRCQLSTRESGGRCTGVCRLPWRSGLETGGCGQEMDEMGHAPVLVGARQAMSGQCDYAHNQRDFSCLTEGATAAPACPSSQIVAQGGSPAVWRLEGL